MTTPADSPEPTRDPLTEDEVEFILYCMGVASGSQNNQARADGMLARALIIREKLCARFDV